jgi:hypothetical protein
MGVAPASSVDEYLFFAASGATSVSGADYNGSTLAYTAGTEQVYLNGVLLVRNQDYSATSGTSIAGLSAMAATDVVTIITYNPSNIEKTNAILETVINAKGDLIAGTASDTAGILSTGTNGQYLKVNTGTATGLEWGDPGDLTAVSAGTGITVTNGTGPIPSVAISTSQSDLIIKGFEEDVNVVAAAATGTINFDVSTASIWYYTSNAGANHTLNFRYSSTTSLNDILATGDAMTLVWLNTNGATPYYPNVITVDGATSGVNVKVPSTISAGNASAIDAYSFTLIKTAATSYTVLETQTKFA